MRFVLSLVDDFYADFPAIRTAALGAEYQTLAAKNPRTGKYPGRNSVASFGTREALEKLTLAAGSRVVFAPSIASGHFRTTVAGDMRELDVHIDSTHLSALVYLNTPDQCSGRTGTCFWKHKPTGLLSAPSDPVERQRMLDEVIVPDSLDKSKWELQVAVPMVSNRLLMFSALLFHSAHDEFGHDLESGRLIQTFFLDRV